MDILRYRDFEIEISPGTAGRYPVAVLDSPSGQGRSTMTPPWDRAGLEMQLAALEDAVLDGGQGASQVVQTFGAQLFDALFVDDVRTVYDRSRQAVVDSGEGLRIKLRINALDLATVPWEFLFDPRTAEFLALSRLTPIVRYLELPLGESMLAVKPPLRVLGLVASPSDAVPLDAAREKSRLEEALRPLQETGKVELVWLEGQTWRDLQAAMQGGPWHILHFIGHATFDQATDEGVLLLADEAGRAAPISATQLGRLLSDHQTLRLAVLNACEGAKGSEQSRFSSTAAALVSRGLPAVLAMQYAISDRAAIEFTASFYGALAANLPIDAATSEARKAINLALSDSSEWGTPVLFMRTPDGALWDMVPKRKLPVAAIAGIVGAGVVVLTLLIWLVAGQARVARIVSQPTPTAAPSPTATPTPTPAAMAGTFNIAVTDFGQLDPTTGQVLESSSGRLLSQWLAQTLASELQTALEEDLPGRPDVWHDAIENPRKNVQLGTVLGDSPQARHDAAAKIAENVNATMVVYGTVVGVGEDSELTVEFYLRPGLSKDEFDSLVGTEQLGRPILGPFDAADPLANLAVEKQLRWRAQALFWLTQGLVLDLGGQPDLALEFFDRAEQELRDWPDRDGKEILYFFQGREHFFLSERSGQDAAQQLDEAQRLFEKAVDLRPDYARARAALGSLHRRRAQQIADPAAQLADPNLGQAIDLQEQALQDARAAQDPLLEALVGTALAKSYRLSGDAHYFLGHDADAAMWLGRAISLVEQVTPVLEEKRAYRVLAQAHETQGAAFTQQSDILRSQGDIAGAQESIRQAVSAYESCIAQGDKARFDEFLQQQVIAPEPTPTGDQVATGTPPEAIQGCEAGLASAKQIAQQLQGAQP